mgnify:CR=1 FL=1
MNKQQKLRLAKALQRLLEICFKAGGVTRAEITFSHELMELHQPENNREIELMKKYFPSMR